MDETIKSLALKTKLVSLAPWDRERFFETLSFREREVLKLRHIADGSGNTYELDEVARIFKIEPQRVQQIEMKALGKLRSFLAA